MSHVTPSRDSVTGAGGAATGLDTIWGEPLRESFGAPLGPSLPGSSEGTFAGHNWDQQQCQYFKTEIRLHAL